MFDVCKCLRFNVQDSNNYRGQQGRDVTWLVMETWKKVGMQIEKFVLWLAVKSIKKYLIHSAGHEQNDEYKC